MAKKITILATSDVHGFVMPYRYDDQQEVCAGMARIASLFKRERDENTLCIDNGDCIQGSPMTFYYNRLQNEAVHPMSAVLRAMNYDYINLGNHDFNEGQAMLKKHIVDCEIPCLTMNVKIDGEAVSKPYHIHCFPNGVRIAIFGIVTQHIVHWETKEHLIGIELENAFDAARRTVQMIRDCEQVDAVIGVYHGGFERDLQSGEPTEVLNGENLGYRICQEIEGLDILITGHQHRSIAGYCGSVLVSQTACNGREVAKIIFDCESRRGEVELLKPSDQPDATIMALIERTETACQKWLDQPLGTSHGELLIEDGFQARLHKHPLVSFMNQVQFAQYPQADFSAVALFNDARGFRADITMRDIVSTYVYSNTLVALRMSGALIKEFLERCAEYFEMDGDEIVVSPRFAAPKPSHFNYDMVDGLTYTIHVARPIGQRVDAMEYRGKPLDMEASYTMLVSNYRASGGGDFDMLQRAEVVADIQRDMVECIAEYILQQPMIQVRHSENITVIP